MAIQELNEEQIREWSLERKDRWWLENVYRGNMPQLTVRSALTGMCLGSVLSLTNIYIGAKTGWTLGVGITSVILAFAVFKALAAMGLASEFTILENNAMQSIATAAGYMTSPLISSLAAYMMVTGHVIPMWQLMSWVIVLAILGVLFAFPFKRRFINEEQQPFPEGRAAGIVMDSLHHGDAATGLLKAKLMLGFGALAGVIKFFQSETITAYLGIKEHLKIPEFLDDWLYEKLERSPTILGASVKDLTIRPELDLPMVGAGGLMGIRTGASLLIGAIINYALLAPIMIDRGDIVPNAKTGEIGFRDITFWSLWCGVAMMTAASLVAFFGKPKLIWDAFAKMLSSLRAMPPSESEHETAMKKIELPLSVSLIGVPFVGCLVTLMAKEFFDVEYYLSAIALALVFVFCLIAINSTGMTSITPIGAMGKLTQLTFGAIAPRNKQVNLITAGITGEVASHAANLLQDIKPGYMLGAKPRQQAVGHLLGIFAGAVLSIPIFYLVFLKVPAENLTALELDVNYQIDVEKYPMPAATVWKSVADVLANGVDEIKESARYAALVGILIGVAMEIGRIVTKNRFPLSPLAIGLGFLVPFNTCLSMFLGSLFFFLMETWSAFGDTRITKTGAENKEPICAGLIAGGALMGIIVAIADVVLPGS